jgi:chromosome segregation ATPase
MSSNQKVKQLRDKLNHHTELMGAEMDVDYVNMLLDKIVGELETEPIDVTHEFDEKHYKETLELHETTINAIMDENREVLIEYDAKIAESQAVLESNKIDYNELVKKYNELVKTHTDKNAEWKTYTDEIKTRNNEERDRYKRRIKELESTEKEYKMTDGTKMTFDSVLEERNRYLRRIKELESTEREYDMSDGTKMTFKNALEERNRYSSSYNELLQICNQGGRVSVTNGVDTTTYNIMMADRNKIVKEYDEVYTKWMKLVKEHNDLSKKHTIQTGEIDVMRIDMACLQKDAGKISGGDMTKLLERNQRICDGKDRVIEQYKRQVEALDNELRKKATDPITFGGGGGDCEGLKRTIQTMTRDHATKIEELTSSTQHLPSVKYDKLLEEHKQLNKKYDTLKSRCGDAKADISAMRQIEHLTNELKQRDERIKELRTACILGQDC